MITKEFIEDEEVFVVDEPLHQQRCSECMFGTVFCLDVPCIAPERDDDRNVYFQPVHDLKTLVAYHAQEAVG